MEEGAEGCSQLEAGMAMGCSRRLQQEPKWMERVRSPPCSGDSLTRTVTPHQEGRLSLCCGLWHQFPLSTQTGVLFSPSNPHPHLQEASQDVQSKGCSSHILHFQLGNIINLLYFLILYPGQHIGGDWSIALAFLSFFHHLHADSTSGSQAIPKVQCPPHRHFVFHQDLIQTGAATPSREYLQINAELMTWAPSLCTLDPAPRDLIPTHMASIK